MIEIENLAHTLRGAVTCFFCLSAASMFPLRKRSRMMWLLFVVTLWLAVCYLKDAVFLFPYFQHDFFVECVWTRIDLIALPFACAFSVEATLPGSTTRTQVMAAVGMQTAFVPIYLIFPSAYVFYGAYAVALTSAVLTLIAVTVMNQRHKRLMSENYSYTENIDVAWVVRFSVIYFILFFVYFFAFNVSSWGSESFFHISCLILWSYLYAYAKRHKVIRDFPQGGFKEVVHQDAPPVNLAKEVLEELVHTQNVPLTNAEENQTEKDAVIATQLEKCMEKDKIYLNPKLTLIDLATAVGTNKTYVSDFLHRQRGVNFYDYVNTYRIQEACRILQATYAEEKLTMAEVAERCGFNSVSSFNRYFVKKQGMTPSAFLANKPKATR